MSSIYGVYWQSTAVTAGGFHSAPCVYVMNATRITKANAFEQVVNDANSIGADIIVLTETWLKEKHANEAFNIPGYKCLRKDRAK